MAETSSQHQGAIDAAMAVMAAHVAALNARDNTALTATLHFPHYRLASGRMQIWDGPTQYLDDFYARAGDGWDHTAWDSLDVLAAAAGKVHLDVRFTRYRADGSTLGRFRSLWIIACEDGRWAAAFRSSFAK